MNEDYLLNESNEKIDWEIAFYRYAPLNQLIKKEDKKMKPDTFEIYKLQNVHTNLIGLISNIIADNFDDDTEIGRQVKIILTEPNKEIL